MLVCPPPKPKSTTDPLAVVGVSKRQSQKQSLAPPCTHGVYAFGYQIPSLLPQRRQSLNVVPIDTISNVIGDELGNVERGVVGCLLGGIVGGFVLGSVIVRSRHAQKDPRQRWRGFLFEQMLAGVPCGPASRYCAGLASVGAAMRAASETAFLAW